jgi:hypothetical protein
MVSHGCVALDGGTEGREAEVGLHTGLCGGRRGRGLRGSTKDEEDKVEGTGGGGPGAVLGGQGKGGSVMGNGKAGGQ